MEIPPPKETVLSNKGRFIVHLLSLSKAIIIPIIYNALIILHSFICHSEETKPVESYLEIDI